MNAPHTRGPTFDESGPALVPKPPLPGVQRVRASVWCGRDGHPRRSVTGRDLDELDKAEQQWRCPACGAADPWTDRPKWKRGRGGRP